MRRKCEWEGEKPVLLQEARVPLERDRGVQMQKSLGEERTNQISEGRREKRIIDIRSRRI